jgi:hypothetical protein
MIFNSLAVDTRSSYWDDLEQIEHELRNVHRIPERLNLTWPLDLSYRMDELADDPTDLPRSRTGTLWSGGPSFNRAHGLFGIDWCPDGHGQPAVQVMSMIDDGDLVYATTLQLLGVYFPALDANGIGPIAFAKGRAENDWGLGPLHVT